MKQTLRILTICALLVYANHLNAQFFRFGIKAGVGISNLHFSSFDAIPDDQVPYAGLAYNRTPAFRPSLLLGAVMEFDLTKEFVFSTGIQLTPRYSNTVLNYLPKSENEVRVRLNYLQIPVTCYYRKRQMFFGLGGYWGACLWGNWETEERYYDNNIVFNTVTTDGQVVFGTNPEQQNLKRMDYGFRGEIGYALKTFRLSIAYDHGLFNMAPTGVNANMFEYDGNLKQQALFLTLTYYRLAK
ncbi:MAG: outer membrane beta-barrel protein [Saprospiraceae bacterium]|nr:outer membrane beta-barrel protein [Saprospiraceae bacterium]